jgi:hypothetical protein
MCRPTKSRIFHVQSLGRGLTAHPGKKDCLILDHAGNCLRLGMCDEISSDVLDDGDLVRSAERQPDKEPKEAKLCPECHAVQQAGARECWQCGHKFLAVTLVREREGELIEFGSRSPGTAGFANDEVDYSGQTPPAGIDKQREWYAGLLWIARNRGYKDGAVFYQFKEKFGHKPSWPPWQNPPPSEPTVGMRNWVRSRLVAYAKARQRYG